MARPSAHILFAGSRRGVPTLKQIQELARHKTHPQMSARYAHLNEASVLQGLPALLESDEPPKKRRK